MYKVQTFWITYILKNENETVSDKTNKVLNFKIFF